MKSIQTEMGILSVDLGDGWLSCDEAQSVKPGDIVKVNTFAGDALTMRFNGFFLASCEMVVLGDIWGARIVSFVEPPGRHRIPQVQGSMTEILPVTVRMGSIRISLRELESLGKGSIISLGKPYSDETDAELLIAGIWSRYDTAGTRGRGALTRRTGPNADLRGLDRQSRSYNGPD